MHNPQVANETTLTLKQFIAKYGWSRHQFHLWMNKGLLSRKTSTRFWLDWCQRGSKRITSVEAYKRFDRQLNGLLESPSTPEGPNDAIERPLKPQSPRAFSEESEP